MSETNETEKHASGKDLNGVKLNGVNMTNVDAKPGLSSGVDADAVLGQLGQAGQFHLRMYALVALAAIQVGLLHTTYIFLAADVPYRCAISECESLNTTEYSPSWLNAALPAQGRERRCYRRSALVSQDSPLVSQDSLIVPQDTLLVPQDSSQVSQDSLLVPQHSSLVSQDSSLVPQASLLHHSCNASAFSDELLPCDNWLYAAKNTIVAEFNLACQEWKRTLVGTVHNIGMLVSLPIMGYISDRWGRKRALVLSCTLVGAIGTMKAFSVSYEMYIVVEFLETIAGASAFPAAYILTIELLGQDKRVLTTAFLGIMLVIGGISFALLAKTFQYWRTFILVVYPPSLLFLLYIYLLPESIRWLLSKGRKEEAVELITRAAKMNKVTLSGETLKQLQEEKVIPLDEKKKEEEEGLWIQVLHSPIIMTRLAICSWWWITCTFVFYGLAINSVSLAGDKYTNYMLVVSVEVVAVVANALVLDRIGRKRTLLIAYTVCGLACITLTFIPKSLPWLSTLLYLVGKVGITQAFSGIYMYTSELFPTHARHSLLGFCSMVGRVGSIVAPQMPLLAIYVEWLPSVLFGAAALIAGGLMLTTPETLHTRLPDTIREAELIAKQPRRDDIPMNTTC